MPPPGLRAVVFAVEELVAALELAAFPGHLLDPVRMYLQDARGVLGQGDAECRAAARDARARAERLLAAQADLFDLEPHGPARTH